MIDTRLAGFAIAAGLCAAGAAGAQQQSQDAPGLWMETFVHVPEGAPSGAAELGRSMARIVNVARAVPALTDLRGSSGHPAANVYGFDEGSGVVKGAASILLKPIDLDSENTVFSQERGGRQGVGEGPSLSFYVNDLGRILSVNETDQGATFAEPMRIGDIGGYPVYDRNGKPAILIAVPGRSPWIPVTQEEHIASLLTEEQGARDDGEAAYRQANDEIADELRIFLENRDAELAQMAEEFKLAFPDPAEHAEQMAFMRQMYDEREQALREALGATGAPTAMSGASEREAALAAELAGLSAAERRAPACFGGESARPSLLAACGPESRRLVRFNPNYFDRNHPAAIQSVVVELEADRQSFAALGPDGRVDAARAVDLGYGPGHPFIRLASAREQMDLRAIGALLR